MKMMKVAIIGAGNVGTALARAMKEAGHEVTVASPSAEDLEAVAEQVDVKTTLSNHEAVNGAHAVVIAVPFGVVKGVVSELAEELAGKVVVDATNTMNADYSGLATEVISGAELVQEGAPKARVVKAFNTVLAANQADPIVDGTTLDGFVAGDDAEAKEWVLDLVGTIGYRPIDAGPLSAARYLEAMAFLNISLNGRNSWPWKSGWKLVGPVGA